ncbi:helix-turn-helix domain-containing protein (plasmid) [Rhizobium leguminosarum]|uniref:GlxA family transcriptional regulator n=1 Tax=Rhizobium leguminosarum TaxID=384 RepID=UPI001441FA42|nr:helix-turn-helix domain-containing protein [Rhizobium leguminosarum]MBY5835321.1 helix-turn-helix domain-containing protein [Rhizobium leguminosarum]NKM80543.1 helix-turn-helix domain-containing protein [Rhizobium leguminosarum bv. viciae]QSZ11138.1 helix-turn-helix domain-containing protein [Rhizobium leguminosarum]
MTDAAQPFDIPVFVVVPPRVLLLDVAGPIEVLRKANLEQRTVRFTVTYIGPSVTVGSSIGLAVTGVAALPERLPDGALIVIAGSADAPMENNRPWDEQERADQAAIVAWLKRAILPGIRLVSICSGALLAAEAGMLDGRDCTTHHACIEDLARLAPTARVRDNRLYVEDGDRLTSAGITAGIDLMLHIVAEVAGHACALAVARYLVVYLRRGGSDPQLSPWLEGRNHIHPVIHRAQDAVVANPSQEWSVASLARLSGASPRNLSRLFNEQTGMSVTDFVNLMRVALAREMLAGSRLDMEAVAMRAGFGSARQLRRAWNRLNDGPPSAARSRLPAGS